MALRTWMLGLGGALLAACNAEEPRAADDDDGSSGAAGGGGSTAAGGGSGGSGGADSGWTEAVLPEGFGVQTMAHDGEQLFVVLSRVVDGFDVDTRYGEIDPQGLFVEWHREDAVSAQATPAYSAALAPGRYLGVGQWIREEVTATGRMLLGGTETDAHYLYNPTLFEAWVVSQTYVRPPQGALIDLDVGGLTRGMWLASHGSYFATDLEIRVAPAPLDPASIDTVQVLLGEFTGLEGSGDLGVAVGPALLQFQGGCWKTVDLELSGPLEDVAVVSPNEAWTVGESGVFRLDSLGWSRMDVAAPVVAAARDILVLPSGIVMLAGDGLWRLDPAELGANLVAAPPGDSTPCTD